LLLSVNMTAPENFRFLGEFPIQTPFSKVSEI
jgi:hypothetical protein